MIRLTLFALLLSLTQANVWTKLPSAVYTQSRRLLNFSSLFGSATKACPYERVMGHPVFSVTTPWGSPYMNMEKLSDLDEVVQPDYSGKQTPQSLSEEQNEYRTVALYFLDPDDALQVHGEMKQMEQMENQDIRLTSFSLGKALRQAANLSHGLVTGAPVDALDGKVKVDEGGALRYKIVPPKRQLYYAARCIGKERVGLFSDNPTEDAQTAVIGNSALEGINLARRREKRERKTPKSKRTPMQAANAHMEGYTGIPVFYCPQMRRSQPKIKQLFTGVHHETPMFFNYEDMEVAYNKMRQRHHKQAIPEKPENVEVFNLWDLLSSMDRYDYKKRQQKVSWVKDPLAPIRERFSSKEDLDSITFVPSSRSVQYKEAISARGNGKARLRPMR